MEYLRMAALEDTLWWYRALHAMLIEQLNAADIAPCAHLLDARLRHRRTAPLRRGHQA